jgi:hypothetical protein
MKISHVKGVWLGNILPEMLISTAGYQTRNVSLARNSDAIRTYLPSIIFLYIS